jgi:hypothetical protein
MLARALKERLSLGPDFSSEFKLKVADYRSKIKLEL